MQQPCSIPHFLFMNIFSLDLSLSNELEKAKPLYVEPISIATVAKYCFFRLQLDNSSRKPNKQDEQELLRHD